MPRIVGVDIPENKRLEVALTYIYGVGRSRVTEILEEAGVSGDKRTNQLSAEELAKIQKAAEKIKVEGDLRKEVAQNISRLKEIGAYRGTRHARGLPARGQRTRTNARTRKSKKVTIGALKKEALAQVEASKVEKEKKEAKAK